jgi:predicted transcriptional regulator
MDDKKETKKGSWTFLTNHARVLLMLVKEPESRMREVAEKVGITERAVQHIIADLARTGYIDRTREGRRNVYKIHHGKPLRHSLEGHLSIDDLVEFISEIDKEEEDLG